MDEASLQNDLVYLFTWSSALRYIQTY